MAHIINIAIRESRNHHHDTQPSWKGQPNLQTYVQHTFDGGASIRESLWLSSLAALPALHWRASRNFLRRRLHNFSQGCIA
jgi:hypothetical protein